MSRISRRIANRRAEPLQKLIVFPIGQQRFALPIQFAQKVISLEQVYGNALGGVGLTRYLDRKIPVMDIERRVFGEVFDEALGEALAVPADIQRHLLIVEDLQGEWIGIPFNQPPMLRRVPKSAFAPVPERYVAEGKIRCISAIVTLDESEPPLFLLNLDQLLLPTKAIASANASLTGSS